MRESVVENYLKKQVHAHGGDVRKLQWIGRRGAPDRLVLFPNHAFFVELKAPGKTPTLIQQLEHSVLREAGLTVVVIDSKEAVDVFLEGLHEKLSTL